MNKLNNKYASKQNIADTTKIDSRRILSRIGLSLGVITTIVSISIKINEITCSRENSGFALLNCLGFSIDFIILISISALLIIFSLAGLITTSNSYIIKPKNKTYTIGIGYGSLVGLISIATLLYFTYLIVNSGSSLLPAVVFFGPIIVVSVLILRMSYKILIKSLKQN